MITSLIPLQANAGNNSSLQSILMIVLLIAIFYFMMIRPQQKKQKEIKKFREGLEKGDSVITAGGIYGKIKEIKDTYLILTIADGVNIRIDKGSVYQSPADAQTENQTANK